MCPPRRYLKHLTESVAAAIFDDARAAVKVRRGDMER